MGSLAELRETVRRSFRPVTYEPRPCEQADEAYDTFLQIQKGSES
jgi:hypothetical protein